MSPIVAWKADCRHCGAPVEPLEKCSRCGKRAILAFFWRPSWTRR